MFTQCQHCGAVYPVDAKTIAQARGQVRCGHCGGVFNALERLTDQAPINPDSRLPVHVAADMPPVLARAGEPESSADLDGDYSDDEVEYERAHLTADDQKLLRAASERARFAERERAVVPKVAYSYSGAAQKAVEPKRGRFWSLCALVLLTLTLLAQLAMVYRKPLLEAPQVAATVNALSARAGVPLPPIAAPEHIVLLSRSVDKHPSEARALLVNLNLNNQAEFPVRYPWIELKLSDLNGRAVAMRRFAPEEYLAEPARMVQGMAAGDLLAVSLELEDPGQDALAFEFAFR
jgi:predicted Zn finger-like uncharacterized protein